MSIKQGINSHIKDFSGFLSVLNILNIFRIFFVIFRIFLVMLIIISISFMPSVAHSHKVNIFAYAEDNKIFTESYFNDGSPCKGSMIQVFDPAGNELLQGKTDEEGTFSFKVPMKTDLRIVLTASMGHKAEYRMPASELPEILDKKTEEPVPSKIESSLLTQKIEPSPLSEPLSEPHQNIEEEIPFVRSKEDSQKIKPFPFIDGKPGEIADQNSIQDNSTQPLLAVDPDQIRSVVEDAVDRSIERKMRPLMNSMIHSIIKAQTSRVAFRDIIGGIGYIFGIMGLILYFNKREN